MNRLQKKCTMASIAMHAVLALIVIVGPAFLISEKPPVDLPILKVIPGRLVDDAMFGGGNPNAKVPPATARETPQSSPQPPTPAPEPPKAAPIVEPEPKPVAQAPKDRPKPVKPVAEPSVVKEAIVKPPKSKPDIKVDPKIVARTPKEVTEAKVRAEEEQARAAERAQARAAAEARRQALQRFSKSLDGAASSISDNLSQGTTVEMPGPGGAAYANYGQAIKSIYDGAWVAPMESAGSATSVKVELILARDGSVVSDRIIKHSSDPALERSVQNTLERVRRIGLPPFPPESKDSRRTFILNFNLQDKLGTG